MKKIYISLAVVVLLVLGMTFPRGNTVVQQVVGASGQTESFRKFFNQGFTAGGTVSTTSTAATYTTAAKDFAGTPTFIKWTPNIITTVSLSSTSTNVYVPNIGDTAVIYIWNASSTAAGTITLAAADANLDLQKNEDVADLAIAGLDWGKITLIRQSKWVVTAIYENFVPAD